MSHGTQAGFQQHLRSHEPPCDACRDAWNAAQRVYQARARARKIAQGITTTGGSGTAGKRTKFSVDYRRAMLLSPKRCGTCCRFQAANRCSLVAGAIRTNEVCDEWKEMGE